MSDFNSHDFIQQARDAYYKHIYEEDGQRITITDDESERFSDTTWAWPSNLGRCPLQQALSRHEAPQTHPATPEEKRFLYGMFEQGNDAEKFIVEACVFYHPYTILPQFRLNYNEEGQTRATGKADMVVLDGDVAHIFEVKRPLNANKPSYHWVLQTLFYGMAAKEQGIASEITLHIVVRNNYDVIVWDFEEDSGGYLIRNADNGELWDNPMNDPSFISFTRVISEIFYAHNWLRLVADNVALESGIPIEDPANAEDGWQCVWKGKNFEPKIYKTQRNAERYAEGRYVEQTLPVYTEGGYPALNTDGSDKMATVYLRPGTAKRNCNWLCHSSNQGPFPVWPIWLIEDGTSYKNGRLFIEWESTLDDVSDPD